MGQLGLVLVILLAGCRKAPEPSAAAVSYVDGRVCAGCHAGIAKTYRETAMAQAYARVTPAAMAGPGMTGVYAHKSSGRTYEIVAREGRYFARRWETGYQGQRANEMEREIHYVMGSGRHARTFIHRTAQGRLTELPLGWYAEGGGTLAMSPGYDRADPLDFRRKVSFDCMFCHNGYPAIAEADARPSKEPVFPSVLPEGIDCQRCHGPGSAHVAAAGKTGAKAEEIRAAIVNPARLGAERGMEVCLQCHLETTSFPLPNSLVRFERGAFSYRPGEPLGDFVLHFDHARGTGREEKYEIVNSAYRLRQSRCFSASAGKMQCTTCHNPHDVPRGEAAVTHYAETCRGCHAVVKSPHPAGEDCAGCHMPKRRTEDVVHAVMTDHKIVRRPPAGNLLAMRAERHGAEGKDYQGEVALYYPPAAKDQEMYLAVAQVVQKSNLAGGIPRLEAFIRDRAPAEPRVYFALAQAYEAAGRVDLAEAQYREAVRRDAGFVAALQSLGALLRGRGAAAEAVGVLERARGLAAADAGVLYELGLAYRDVGRGAEAMAALEKAVANDGDFPQAYNTLGGLRFEARDVRGAEAALREAVRQQPDFAEAQGNLGQVLAAGGDLAQGEYHLRAAIRLRPEGVEAWQALGEVKAAQGRWAEAMQCYRTVLRVRPESEAALLGLGTAQGATGDVAGARVSLGKVAKGKNAALRQEALDLLQAMR